MRLVRLRMQNYRRHRDTTIEWPDGVTAVIGRNGSGKSSILEAIGFALFGAGATRTAKDLIRHDQAGPADHVRVDLEAEIGGHAVHVVRELRGKNLSPNASMEVDGVVQAAPGAGSNEAVTEQASALLGMGRDAFFTTVVARQKELAGLADVSPSERKRRILQMMGVDRLEDAIQAARQKRRDAEARADAVRSVLDDPKALAQAVDAADQALAAADGTVAQAEAEWTRAKQALAQASERATSLESAAQAHARLVRRRDEAARERASAEHLLEQARARLAEAHVASKQAASLEPEAQRLPEAEAALEEARQQARRHEAHVQAQRHVAELESEAQRLHAAIPAAPEALDVDLDAADEKLGSARDAAAAAERALAVAKERADTLRARHRRLTGLAADAPCPTCEQPLGARHGEVIDDLHGQYDAARQAVDRAVRDDAKTVQDLDAARQARSEAKAAHDAQVALLQARQTAIARHADAVSRAQAAAKALVEAPPPAPMEPLEAAVQAARRAHEARLAALARAEAAPRYEAEAEQAVKARDAAATDLARLEAEIAAADDPTPALATARTEHAQATSAEREAERALQAARQEAGLRRSARDEARRRVADDERRRTSLRSLEEDARYWAALAGARRDGLLDGFRDHLVQRIGPAIAHEAGRLLGRFTGGRYDEVLLDDDYRLYVTDGGVPYTVDRFSGGEADLVHLALRLAVSRLLAERGGAGELRFLALDEVFGSLDAERRDLVVGALQELGTLYAQVLLVTHLDGMRDALDQAMHVEDVDGGARVTLLG